LGAQSLPRGLDARFPRRFSDIPAMRLEAFNCANGACSQSNGVHAPGPLGSVCCRSVHCGTVARSIAARIGGAIGPG
jgi:hypothetical protein